MEVLGAQSEDEVALPTSTAVPKGERTIRTPSI